MGREAERRTLLTEIRDVWPVEYGPLAWPNVPFETPRNERWAEVFILTYSSERVSLGNDFLRRTYGSLQFNLYCPRDVGSRENKTASDWLEDYFEERVFLLAEGEKIEFQTPVSHEITGIQERQEGTNDNWFRTVVDCPFYREERRRK